MLRSGLQIDEVDEFFKFSSEKIFQINYFVKIFLKEIACSDLIQHRKSNGDLIHWKNVKTTFFVSVILSHMHKARASTLIHTYKLSDARIESTLYRNIESSGFNRSMCVYFCFDSKYACCIVDSIGSARISVYSIQIFLLFSFNTIEHARAHRYIQHDFVHEILYMREMW